MDKVFIEGIEIEALIGIYDWERRIRQPLLLDLEMGFDNRRPAATDAIADTLDYKAVSKRLIEYVSGSSFGLVETLAERCAEIVLAEFDVAWLRLRLAKPGAVRGARSVGVVIERRVNAAGGTAYLSLGSNVAPHANLASAIAALRSRFKGVRVSTLYRTAAVGFDGADFINAAAVVDSDLDVHALDAWLHALEDAHGRDRSGPRNGDRTLDIDIVLFDDLVLDGPGHLVLPRPELERAFVLRPLAELAPDAVEPRSGRTLSALWAASAERGVEMTAVVAGS